MRSLVASLDLVAVLRQASGRNDPRLGIVAAAAEIAGVDAVRAGATESLRPIDAEDLHALRGLVRRLELRVSPTPSLLKLALEVRPDRVILTAEPTAHHVDAPPLDPMALRADLPSAAHALTEAGIPSTVRIAPDPESVKAAHGADVGAVELRCTEISDGPESERAGALGRFADAATLAAKLRLPIMAAGGLDAKGVAAVVAAAPVVESVAVGRALAARALLVGIDRAVGEFRAAVG